MRLIQVLSVSALMTFAVSCKSQNDVSVDVNGETVQLSDGLYAEMVTTNGDVLIRLFYDATPMTVGNFVSLAEGTNELTNVKKGAPYYDGLKFHRVIADFMIQGGDPQGNGSGGPGYAFPDEFVDTLRHSTEGILSMANSGPGTNGSQFFITDKSTPHLDGRHTVFGKVISGMNTVHQIARVPKGQMDRPNEDVIIEKVNIIRVGSDAKGFDAFEALEEGRAEVEARKAAAEAKRAEYTSFVMNELSWVGESGQVDADAFASLYSEWQSEMTTTSSGLGYIILEEGEGEQVNDGDQIKIDYVGYFTTGEVFDSSIEEIAQLIGTYDARRPYQPLAIMAGPSGRQVIDGWKEGTILLKRGSKARLIIPPSLGWGSQGAGNVIPPNATVIFDIHVLE